MGIYKEKGLNHF